MRVVSHFLWMVVVCSFVSTALGQEVQTGPPLRRAVSSRAAAAPERQSAGRLISVDVTIADVTGDAVAEMSADKLAELDKAGKVKALSRFRLSALENQPALVHFGERVSVVTGRVAFPGRAEGTRGFAQESLSQENIGTIINITARVDQDESILIELKAEQTKLAPAAAKAPSDDAAAPSVPRTGTENINTQTTIRVPPGKTVVAGSKETKTEQGIVQTWILVSANAEAARPKAADEAAELKIFTLVNAKADSLAELIQAIFRSDDLRVGVDSRTNSLIVQGDHEKLEVIRVVIQRLDEPQESARK